MNKLKVICLILIVVIFTSACDQIPQKKITIDEYFKKMNSKRVKFWNLSYTMSDKNDSYMVYIKPDKFRIESKNLKNNTFVQIKNRNIVYNYVLEDKPSIAYQYSKNKAPYDVISYFMQFDKNAKYTIGENIYKNSRYCTIITKNTPNNVTKLCISSKYGLPVYINTGKMEINVTDISTKIIPEDKFQPPVTFKIINRTNAD